MTLGSKGLKGRRDKGWHSMNGQNLHIPIHKAIEHKCKVFFYYFILNNLKGTSASVTVTILKKFTDA